MAKTYNEALAALEAERDTGTRYGTTIAGQLERIEDSKIVIVEKAKELELLAGPGEQDWTLDDAALAIHEINFYNAENPYLEDEDGNKAWKMETPTLALEPGYYKGVTITLGNVSEAYVLEEKTVTPSKSVQEIQPTAGKYGLSKVTVNAIPENYQDVTAVTATADDVLAGKVIVTSTGLPVTGNIVESTISSNIWAENPTDGAPSIKLSGAVNKGYVPSQSTWASTITTSITNDVVTTTATLGDKTEQITQTIEAGEIGALSFDKGTLQIHLPITKEGYITRSHAPTPLQLNSTTVSITDPLIEGSDLTLSDGIYKADRPVTVAEGYVTDQINAHVSVHLANAGELAMTGNQEITTLDANGEASVTINATANAGYRAEDSSKSAEVKVKLPLAQMSQAADVTIGLSDLTYSGTASNKYTATKTLTAGVSSGYVPQTTTDDCIVTVSLDKANLVQRVGPGAGQYQGGSELDAAILNAEGGVGDIAFVTADAGGVVEQGANKAFSLTGDLYARLAAI